MNKLPVFETIGRAFWFQIANLFTLFRLTWLPLASLIAAQLALGTLFLQRYGDVTYAHPDGFAAFLWLVVTVSVLQTIALAVVAVRVHQVILFNERRPSEYFAYPFGSTELRYVLMGVLSMVLLVLPFGAAAYLYYAAKMGVADQAAAALVTASQSVSGEGGSFFAPVATIAIAVLWLWLMLRLSVWPAGVVATNRLWPGDTWRATHGNVIRLFLLLFASSVFLVVVILAMQAVFVYAAPAEFLGQLSRTPDEGSMHRTLNDSALIPHAGPNSILFEFLFQFVTTTFGVAIISYAYKALKGFDADVPIDRQSGEPVGDPSLFMKPLGTS